MVIKHFCNSTFQGEYAFEDISPKGKVISFGTLFSINDREYRVTNVLIRSEIEIIIETLKV